jgi:lysophospholipase L1-like esterase
MVKALFVLIFCLFAWTPGFAQMPRLLIVGDSITYGGGSYARLLKSRHQTVIIAKNGVQTGWMLRRLRETNLHGFTHLIVFGGGNDINCGHLAQAGRNLLDMYRLGKLAGLKVVAVTHHPWRGWPSWTPTKHEQTMALNWWIRERASAVIDGVADFYGLVRDPDYPQRLAPLYGNGADGLHPNSFAHQLLFKEMLKIIR